MKPQIKHETKCFSVLCTLIVLLFAGQAYSQAAFAKKVMGMHYSKTIQTADGGYVSISGGWLNNGSSLLIRKVNSAGEKLWEKKHVMSPSSLPFVDFYGITQTTDDDYVIVGTSCPDTFYCGDGAVTGIVVRLKSNGDIRWVKTFRPALIFSSVAAQENGGFIVAGGLVNWPIQGSPATDVMFIRFSSSGAVLSATRLGIPQKNVFSTPNIVATPDHGFFLTMSGSVIRGNSAGKILWKNSFEIENSFFEVAASTLDNGVVLSATNRREGKLLFLLKLNPSGQIEWKKKLIFSGPIIYTAVNQASDSGYLTTGALGIGATPSYEIFLLKTDPNGEVVFTKTYSLGTKPYGFPSVTFSSQKGGFFLFGSDSDGMDLLKLNSGGVVPGCRFFRSITPLSRELGDVKTSTPRIFPRAFSVEDGILQKSVQSDSTDLEVSTVCE